MPEGMEAQVSDAQGSGGLAPGLESAQAPPLPEITPSGEVSTGGKLTEQQIIDSINAPAADAQQQAKPDVQAQADGAEPVQEAEPTEEELPLTEEDLSVAKIQSFAKEVPELAQAFAKNPAIRNTVFAMARRSAKLGEYQQVFATPENAKFAAENSESYMALNDLFFSEEPEAPQTFWQTLYDNSLVRDPQSGELVIDPTTRQPQSTGAYERIAGQYRQFIYSDIEQRMRQMPQEQAENVKNALAWVKHLCGDSSPQEVDNTQLPQHVQKQLQEAQQLKQQLQQDKSARVQEFHTQTLGDITTTIKDDIGQSIKRIVEVNKVALTQYEQRNVVNDVYNELNRLAGENQQYQLHFDDLLKRSPQTEAGRKALVAEARKFSKELLPSVIQKVIREAVGGKVDTSTPKPATRVVNREVKTVGGAPSPTSQDIRQKAQELSKQLKRPLKDEEILAL